MHGKCDRARQWASLELDGELSGFERALLENHVGACPSCAEFREEINGLTNALRAAPYEQFEGIVLGRIRRRVRIRLAPAAAAMAVAAVGLGSIVASSSFQGSPVAHFAAQGVDVSSVDSASAAIDNMNLSKSRALETKRERTQARLAPRGPRDLHGGPVISKP